MRFTREQAAAAVSAPIMAAGLVAVALAESLPLRLGGAAMVIGASLALALTGARARRLAWTLAALGAVAVVTSCF
jgi:hypothetical protein